MPTNNLPLVAIVILNYNGRKYLEQFLPYVLATSYKNYQIVVADNGSTDDSIAYIKKEYADTITLIDLKRNYGFAGGYNEALKRVDAPYYVLLNSDVEVKADWLDPIIDLMEQDTRIAACQPKVLSYHKKDFFEYAGASGGYIDYLGYPFCRGRILETCETDKNQYDTIEEVFWATGAAMVVRAELYQSIQGLDADYFAHMEEIDLCWRLKRAGYKIKVHPLSVVYHVGGGTLSYQSRRKTFLNFRNSLYTIFKNESTLKLLWLIPIRLTLDGVAGIMFLTKGQVGNMWEIIRAHGYFYANIFKLIKKRRAHQRIVEQTRIRSTNAIGQITQSIIWKYYISGKKTFREIVENREI